MQETVSGFQLFVDGVETFEFRGLRSQLCKEAVYAVGAVSSIAMCSLFGGLLAHTSSCGLQAQPS